MRIASLIAVLALSASAWGQADGPVTTLQLGARLVQVPVVVRDKKGAPV